MVKPERAYTLTAGQLIAAGVMFEASLPQSSVAMLPVPTRRGRRAMWAYLGVGYADSERGERYGPVHAVRLVPLDGGPVRNVAYQGPSVSPFLLPGPPISASLAAHLRREIVGAAQIFFAGAPANRVVWMRVALRSAFPGPLWDALRSVAPDFLTWLADTPYDRAQ